jgi:hypothetical protein
MMGQLNRPHRTSHRAEDSMKVIQKWIGAIVSQTQSATVSRLGFHQKTIKIALFSPLLILATVQCYAQQLQWIPFEWSGYQAKTRYFENASIMVNCTIDNLKYPFKMQFDLGATKTVIYGKTFQSFPAEFAVYEHQLDTTNLFWYNSKQYPTYKAIDLKLGKVLFKKTPIGKYTDYGFTQIKDSIDFSKPLTIGTIGPDLFQDKFLIIDYPNHRIAVADKLPNEYANVTFTSIKKENGRIFIPLEMNGKSEYLLFDTGIAMFPILTSQKNAMDIADTAIKDSIDVNTWGKKYFVYGNQITKSVKLGNKELPKGLVHYDKIEIFDFWFERDKFWGIIGNAYFKNSVLIIDYKNNKIAVN